MAVSIEAGDAVKRGVPEALFETRIRSSNRGTPLPAYDVTSDGERFLIANQTDEAMTQSLTVITNWRAKLRNR